MLALDMLSIISGGTPWITVNQTQEVWGAEFYKKWVEVGESLCENYFSLEKATMGYLVDFLSSMKTSSLVIN